MKKTLIALAALAAAGAASAQSSVTLFGIVDATIQRVDNGSGSAVTRLHNSGESSSRLGFRGTEDLGGGMSAQFWLEAGVNNDDGTGAASSANNQTIPAFNATTGANAPVRSGTQGLTFNRRSTVSLAGGFGEIRLGRDYTPQFHNLTVFDPFGTVGVGQNLLITSLANASGLNFPTSTRASNTIGYFLPGNLGGFYGQVQAYRGENLSNTANSSDGNGYGLRFGYSAGPINAAIATSRTTYALNTTARPFGNIRQSNAAVSYNFGVATAIAEVARDSMDSTTGRWNGRGWLLGTTVPVGAGVIKGSIAQYTTDVPGTGTDPRARKYALGYVHNLSKRTAIYTTYARVKNSNGSNQAVIPGVVSATTTGASSTGYDLGIRHSF